MIYQELLELLTRNKHFPHYAAERRIDVFINYFLEAILSVHYKENVTFVAPEFPLKKYKSGNRTIKLDYLCTFQKSKQPIFIELKTDTLSLKEEQIMLYCSNAKSWPSCIDTLKSIMASHNMPAQYKEKYSYLIDRLLDADLIKFAGEGTHSLAESKNQYDKELKDLIKNIEPQWSGEAKLLILAPNDEKIKKRISDITENCAVKPSFLDFDQIAEMRMRSDILSTTEFDALARFLKDMK